MADRERRGTIAALMTAPRYEPVYARNYIEMALKRAGNIPLTISNGVFYGQCMQRMLVDCVEKKIDYVLTIDFDSMFTEAHITRLLYWICAEEQIDAVAAIQPKRGEGSILGAVGTTKQEIEYKNYPIQMDSMHFGLTIIDVNKLAKVPKPWFFAEPNQDGDWQDSKIDDDVWFWKQWKKAGNTAFIDPGTRLGHLEEMISIYDDQAQLQHYYPKEWEKLRETTVDRTVEEVSGGACVS